MVLVAGFCGNSGNTVLNSWYR